jgi:hypothetical protein
MTTPSYYVTIDSEFRDDQKYPFPTDFSVKFKDNTTGTQVLGVPTGSPISQAYFTPLQIDPDYYSSNFRVNNGQIFNFKKLSDNTFLICGIIEPLTVFQPFSIYNDTTTFVSLTGINYYSSFLTNISYTNNAYQFNWITYTQSSGTTEINRCTFDLDDNNNIYYMLDYTAPFDLLQKTSTSNGSNILYSVPNPTSETNSCLCSFALTIDGSIYYVNGHAWGYHILSSNQDVKATMPNGRSNINIDNALNLYISGNINPYDPTFYYYTVPTGSTGSDVSNTSYSLSNTLYTYTGTTYFAGFRNSTTPNVGYWFDRYNISSTGVSNISTSFSNISSSTGINLDIQSNSPWFWVYGNTGYFASTVGTVNSDVYLNSVNLINGQSTFNAAKYVGTNDQNSQAGVSVNSVLVNNYMFVFLPINSYYEYIRVLRADLTNVGGGFSTIVNQSTGYLWSSGSGPQAVPSSLPVYCFQDGNNVYQSLVDYNGWLRIVSFTINPSTYAVTQGTNYVYRVYSNSTSEYSCYTLMFKIASKLYVFVSDLYARQTALVDVTNSNNIFTVSTLPGCTAPCQLYVDGSNYYIIDSSSYVYQINNPSSPVLISSFFPQINSSQYPLINQIYNNTVIGQVTSPSFELFTSNFLSTSVSLDSTQYNLNIDETINTSTTAIIDVVNLTDYPYLVELKGNYMYISNISNIQSISDVTNFNVFSNVAPSTDPNNYRLSYTFTFYTCKTLSHIITSGYIYFFIVFYDTNPLNDWNLLVVQTDMNFQFVQSSYQYLGSSTLTDYNSYITNVVPYTQFGNTYAIIQYFNYPRDLVIYSYAPNTNSFSIASSISNLSYNDLSLEWTYSFNTQYCWYQWGCIVYTYENGATWLFVTLVQNNSTTLTNVPSYLIPINITDPLNPVVYNNPGNGPLSLPQGMFSNQMSVIKYSNTNIQIVTHGTFTGNFAINITNPLNMSYITINGVSNYPYNVVTTNSIFPVYWGDWTNPLGTSIDEVSNNIYAFQTYIPSNGLSSPYNLTKYFTFTNITDLNNVLGEPQIELLPTGAKTQYLKIAYYGQRIYAVLLETTGDYPSMTVVNYRIIDVTNPNYAMEYPPVAGSYPSSTTTSYTGLNGIGLGFIHKLSNEGDPIWINYLGSDATTTQGLNINISNVSIDPSLTYLYVAGGWQNKIEAYNPTGTKVNLITSSFTNYNGFVARVDLSNNGTFSWVIPSYGTNDIYFERLNYISSRNLVGLVGHFSTPIMLIYNPQTSSVGPFTNPITSQVNLANSSSSSGFLATLSPAGLISYTDLIYTNVSLRNVKVYDIAVDESTSTNRSIKIVGISNTNLLKCIDSTKTDTQDLYSDINPLTEQYLFIYSYDLSGVYQYSERTEFPINMTVNVQDIKSFSLNNRVIVFPNIYSTVGANTISIYNKDGSLATTINDYLPSAYNSIIIQYQYDPTYTDVNGSTYSKIVLQDYFGYQTESLVNYHMFIQGNLFDTTTGTSTQIASTTTLNKNFSIRHNMIENGKDVIILNQVIATKNLIRTNLPYQGIDWAGSISPSELPSIISYNTDLFPSNYMYVTALYGGYISTDPSITYYLTFPRFGEIAYVQILSVTYNPSTQQYVLQIADPMDLDILPGPAVQYYGPNIYLTQTNKNAYYTLQFSPGTIYDRVYYTVKLNSLLIPNRRITSSYLPGARSINDFRYIYLELYNEDDNGNFDTAVINNTFTNNQNFVSIGQRTKTLFEIPISGVSVSSDPNFVVLSTAIVPNLVITPGFYNLHMRLVDMYGTLIMFDQTPNPSKSGDSIFTGSIVSNSLIQIAANFTFNRIIK